MKLCDEDYSGILQGKVEKINVKKLAGLAHFAVSHILEEKCLKKRKEPSTVSTQNKSTQNKAPVISPRKESAETVDAKRAKLEKYVGESLVKNFVDENTGDSVPYGGHVERLWMDEDGKFLFRVNYLDGDTEDVELEDVKGKSSLLSITLFTHFRSLQLIHSYYEIKSCYHRRIH